VQRKAAPHIQQTSTILPAHPGLRISLCARAFGEWQFLANNGAQSAVFEACPAWMSASSSGVMPQSVKPRIEARLADED
jgi:hypothetical protein